MNLQKLALRGVALALLSGLLTSCATTSKESSLSDESDIEQRDDREIVDDIPEDLGEIQVGKRSPEEEEADRLASQTFPIVQNPYVQKWLDFFTVNKRGRRTFEKWMARSTRYIPIIKPILQEHGMPEDLIYLSMIESGFNPRAYSHAHAVGPWQFIRATGKRYGLNVEFWIDERRDIYKSTHAAARYLKDLYKMFGSWYLAAAAYNAGEGKVLRAVKRDQTRDFWKLERNKRNFRAETRNYVPKIIAAAIIAKNPLKFGFQSTEYQKPFDLVDVEIPGGVDLRDVAKVTKMSHRDVRLINAVYRIGITPPGKSQHKVLLPREEAAELSANINRLKTMKSQYFVNYRIKRGDNLSVLANRFRTSSRTIMRLNGIRNPRTLQIGQRLKIPLPRGSARRQASSSKNIKGKYLVHRVKKGETLSEIAEKHGIGLSKLVKINRLRSRRFVRAGKKLLIPNAYARKSRAPSKTSPTATAPSGHRFHRVKRGENLELIAQRYNTSVSVLLKHNRIADPKRIQIGQKLVIP